MIDKVSVYPVQSLHCSVQVVWADRHRIGTIFCRKPTNKTSIKSNIFLLFSNMQVPYLEKKDPRLITRIPL
uniref:Uncharacterized protein n=1 Tax=Arundo donax TaxID=35708 RepID=A0A0A9DHA5_ARUDO